MREIKFRGFGKDEKGKHWIYGNLLDEKLIGLVAIQDEKCHVWEVDPETVGQYTGMLDCNGKEIYEGDIVSSDFWRGIICMYNACWCAINESRGDILSLFDWRGKLSVIGNIHDNPELLEVEHD